MQALRSQQPPRNPATPLERVNPDQQALEHIKSAAVSLDRAQQFTNDSHMLMVLNIMSGTLNKALLKFDGSAVLQSLQEAIQSVAPAAGPAPGQTPPSPMQMGGQVPPMSGGGLPAAPPPQAPQPQPGAVAQ